MGVIDGSFREVMRRAMMVETAGWSPAQRAALLHRLSREATRLHVDETFPSAGALAKVVEPSTVQTPALDVIDESLEWALSTRDARLIISMPPQEGKTTRVGVWGILRALVQEPNRRCVIASYSDSLARSTARQARNIIREHGSGAEDPLTGAALPDRLGLALAEDKSAAGNWKLAGHRGGLYAVGVGGSLTGQPADVMVIDDPLKGMAEADSKVERDKVITWWESVAQTRLAPGAPVIIIQTRWHEEDLAGHILKNDKLKPEPEWRFVNLPAVATAGVADALERPVGQAMESARGRTPADFERIRTDVGERVWAALYLGSPTPAKGGLFSAEWFDRYRAPEVPEGVVARVVSIDPAETGKGDEAGIIGLAVTGDGRAYVTDDSSGAMQSDQWARTAVLLALATGAGEVVFEAFTTGPTYERVIVDAWRRVREESKLLAKHGGDARLAAQEYARDSYAPADPLAALLEVSDAPVPNHDDIPFVLHPWRAKGDKTARAAGTRQAAATGRLRVVGTLPDLERQAVTWQQGQASPDRLDALVNGFERGMQLMGREASIASPADVAASSAPASGGSGMGANFWDSPIG